MAGGLAYRPTVSYTTNGLCGEKLPRTGEKLPLIGEKLPRTAEELALWSLYRHVRGSYQDVCRLLVQRGMLAEMPTDLDKPIKV